MPLAHTQALPDNSVDESSLIARTRQGDMAALAVLYQAHAPGVHKTVYRLVLNSADAEDILHDVFVGLPELLRSYEEQGHFRAWLRRAAARRALMHLRAAARRREEDIADDATQFAVGSEQPVDALIDIERAISALPHGLRVVFVLRQLEGFTHEEIGSALAITAGASRVRFTRALERIRRHLDRDTP